MKYLLTILLAFSFVFGNAKQLTDTVTVTAQVGAGSKYGVVNVVDNVTGGSITATVTNLTIQNNNSDIASVIVSGSRSISVTGLKAGEGTAVVSCHIVYTDGGDGLQKSEDKTIVIYYRVIAAAHGVKLSLTF